MMRDPFQQLLAFLDQLDEAHLAYDLKHVRDSLMVAVYVSEGYCEIEFFADGGIEAEWFRRDEGVNAVAPAWLETFIAEYRD